MTGQMPVSSRSAIVAAMRSAFSADGHASKRGGAQPPIGAPGAMPQSHAIATHALHGGSR